MPQKREIREMEVFTIMGRSAVLAHARGKSAVLFLASDYSDPDLYGLMEGAEDVLAVAKRFRERLDKRAEEGQQ